MTTVALIGGDGAGKTTVAQAVLRGSGLPVKYLYMGLSTRSSNHALPTSRLVFFLKQKIYRKQARSSPASASVEMPASELEYSEAAHGWLWNTARFLNRLAEAWYRQFISWNYQLHGYVVLYDRHIFFDTAPGAINSQSQSLVFTDRLLFWIMSRWYPKPSLTIFLDAPPELLFRRKGEASPAYLQQQRVTFLKQGSKLADFVRIDASQPLEHVIGEVLQVIKEFCARRSPRGPRQAERGNAVGQ